MGGRNLANFLLVLFTAVGGTACNKPPVPANHRSPPGPPAIPGGPEASNALPTTSPALDPQNLDLETAPESASDASPGPASSGSLPPIYLEQDWDFKMREAYYYTTQGSRLMPYKWFLALEQKDSKEKFAAQENLERYGLIYDPKTAASHDNLPIGFAKDETDKGFAGLWVGLTCAACHTNDITYQGRKLRIDGAPTLADFGMFLTEMADAIKATRLSLNADPEKFNRFATEVYGHAPTADEITNLAGAFQVYALETEGRTFMRTPPIHAGAGRIDAIGQIINALTVFDLKEPGNYRPPTAPVSYPFLWLTPHLDFVQWVPVASNPISRNVGEVLGVFSDATFSNPDQKERLHSTANLQNLADLEDWIATLQPPPWRGDILGEIDKKAAAAGKVLFDRDCRSCHHMPPYDKDGELTNAADNMKGIQFVTITGTPFNEVGTDSTYSLNLMTRTAKTGNLAFLFNNAPVVAGPTMFLGSIAGVVGQAFLDAFPNEEIRKQKELEFSGFRFKPDGVTPAPAVAQTAIQTLKGGPLLGIWATGPFLHNGSVPTMYDLLSPPAERPKVFWVGSRELDVAKMGFVSVESSEAYPKTGTSFRFDTEVPGNSNAGHVYPKDTPYTHEEKMAIIEYLKDPLGLLPPEQHQPWPGAPTSCKSID